MWLLVEYRSSKAKIQCANILPFCLRRFDGQIVDVKGELTLKFGFRPGNYCMITVSLGMHLIYDGKHGNEMTGRFSLVNHIWQT